VSATENQFPELRKAASKTAPAVIQVSVFDASGKLLRTGTGFFVSDDGKFVTNRSLVEEGVNAIATTADKKIHNVAGILAESPEFDVAVLKAEAKQVPFLPLNNVATPESGARVTVVGSPLARREGTNSDTRIAARRFDEKGEWLDLSAPPGNEASGSPVVNENGVVVGIISSDRAKNPAIHSVLSSNSLQSFLAKVEPNAPARWGEAAQASPSPTGSPKIVRKGKIIFNPPPTYPLEARGAKGTGSYRIIFDATGRVKNVQILRSSGAIALDRAAVTALQQWKSEPSPEWTVVVPVSFQPRAN
jgi:TonB family protein